MKLLSPPLQAFLATAQEKTVHAAAEQLHVTQTAVLLNGTKTLSHPLVAAWFHRDPEPAYFSALTNAIISHHACQVSVSPAANP